MPRPKANPIRSADDLPPAYRNFVPLGGFESLDTLPIKEKTRWSCSNCLVQRELSVDNIRANPEADPMRVCLCSTIDLTKKKIEIDNPNVVVIPRYHPIVYNPIQGLPKKAIRYTLKCTKHVQSWAISYHDYLSRRYQTCPSCVRDVQFAEREVFILSCNDDEAVKQAKKVFGQITLSDFQKPDKPNRRRKFTVEVTIPAAPANGNWFPVSTGRMRGKIESLRLSNLQLCKLVKQELTDRKNLKIMCDNAVQFGARIEAYSFKKRSTTPVYTVVTAGKYTKEWTESRACETSFGRKDINVGEKLCMATLQLMFPSIKVWRYHDRSVLKGRELDIYTPEKFKGGLALEYQGHQSHDNDPDTIYTDRWKVKNFEGVLIVITRFSYSPKNAIDKIKKALQEKKIDPEKTPTEDQVIQRHRSLLVDQASKTGEMLEDTLKMGNPDHKLVGRPQEIYGYGKFKYICGSCNQETNPVRVRDYLYRPTSGCHRCKYDRCKDKSKKVRKQVIDRVLGDLKEKVDPQIIKRLSGPEKGVICPRCNGFNFSNYTLEEICKTVVEDGRFVCRICLNTGTKVHDQDVITQHLGNIKHIIATARLSTAEKWWEYVTVERGEEKKAVILLSLSCSQGHFTKRSMRQWQKHLNDIETKYPHRNPCDECEGRTLYSKITDNEILREVRRFHSHASCVQDYPKVLGWRKAFSCGETTNVGKFEVPHGIFVLYHQATSSIEASVCLCTVCADVNERTLSGQRKTYSMIESWWRFRTAVVAALLDRDVDISLATVDFPGALTRDGVIDNLSSIKPKWTCPFGHKSIERSWTNMSSRYKSGYCSQCLNQVYEKHFPDHQGPKVFRDLVKLATKKGLIQGASSNGQH